MVQAASLANLTPGRPDLPGNAPNNTGKKYEHTPTYWLRKFGEELGATIGGEKVPRIAGISYRLYGDALNEPNAIDRQRATAMIYDRLEGKPLQRGELKLEGELNVTGKLVKDYSPEELELLRPRFLAGELKRISTPKGSMIVEANYEFENVINLLQNDSESGDSSA